MRSISVQPAHALRERPGIACRPMDDLPARPDLADALQDLDERERRVVELRHGLDGRPAHTRVEVGRLLKLSSRRVHQLERRALERLRAGHGTAAGTRVSPAGSSRLLQGLVRPWTLLLLWLEPTHGYELVERLAAVGLCAENGAIYRVLRRLEGEGHVRSSWQSSSQGPDRRIYSVTARGIAHLHHDAQTLHDLEAVLHDFGTRYRARARRERETA